VSVRAKFCVTGIKKNFYKGQKTEANPSGVVPCGSAVSLAPQYDPTIDEDRRYSKATPSGSIELLIDNPPAEAFFEPGKLVYVDFTSAD
jgi:hypothetical protein